MASGGLDQEGCPINPKWGASQVSAYPLDVVMESEKLKKLLLCSNVLELAEIPFRIEPGKEGDSPVVEVQAAATELVQGEAEAAGTELREMVTVKETVVKELVANTELGQAVAEAEEPTP